MGVDPLAGLDDVAVSVAVRNVSEWTATAGLTMNRDTGSGVDQGQLAPGSSSTPIAVSQPNRNATLAARGLPDFTALLDAEIAAAAAAQASSASRPSPLGVGELILSARELTGLSQRALASRAGTSQAAVTAMETGNRVPTVRTLMRVAEGAGLELVVGLRRPGAAAPVALGALIANADDGLADYIPLAAPSLFEGPPGH